MAIAGPPDRGRQRGTRRGEEGAQAGRRQERSGPDRGRQATRAPRPRPPSRGPQRAAGRGRRPPGPGPPQRPPPGGQPPRADGRRRPADRPQRPPQRPLGSGGGPGGASGPAGARGPAGSKPEPEAGPPGKARSGPTEARGAKAEHTTEAPPEAGQLGRGAPVAGPGPRPSSMGCGGRSPRGPRRRRGRAAEPPGRAQRAPLAGGPVEHQGVYYDTPPRVTCDV